MQVLDEYMLCCIIQEIIKAALYMFGTDATFDLLLVVFTDSPVLGRPDCMQHIFFRLCQHYKMLKITN